MIEPTDEEPVKWQLAKRYSKIIYEYELESIREKNIFFKKLLEEKIKYYEEKLNSILHGK